ncbi:MAG: bifunctional aspartate kinase/homoserine dehydrogenase II, partial [Idiomarina sp.]
HHPDAKQFCYIGKVEEAPSGNVRAFAQLQPIDVDSPYAHLPPGNANFIIRSRQYQHNPLIIQGPGAGPEVTAAGVQSDILELLKRL